MSPCEHFDDDELVYICTGNGQRDNEDEPCFFGDVYDMYDIVAMCFYCGREVPLVCDACTPQPPGEDETDEFTDDSWSGSDDDCGDDGSSGSEELQVVNEPTTQGIALHLGVDGLVLGGEGGGGTESGSEGSGGTEYSDDETAYAPDE